MMPYRNKNAGTAKIYTVLLVLFIALMIFGGAFALYYLKGVKRLTDKDIAAGEKIFGLKFTQKEKKMMLDRLKRNLSSYENLRKRLLENHIPPSFQFNPILPGMSFDQTSRPFSFTVEPNVSVPENYEDLAFYPITALAQLIKNRAITSTELTKLYLSRLKKYGPKLECVITLTEDMALAQAKRADKEIASGQYRGPLHGIPWGAKDLLATKGTKTTWGAMPYKDQVFDENSTVVDRLEKAGAVLVAKLTMGALAMGEVWFGGRTRNPWNPEQRDLAGPLPDQPLPHLPVWWASR